MSLLGAIIHILGGGDNRQFNSAPAKSLPQRPLSPAQLQGINAQIEADGAAMYNAAHPGQVYRTNQNNEFAPGQLPAGSVNGQPNYLGFRRAIAPPALAVPLLSGSLQNRQVNPQMSTGTVPVASDRNSLQGRQNPGQILLQSGRHPFNPQANTLDYTGDY